MAAIAIELGGARPGRRSSWSRSSRRWSLALAVGQLAIAGLCALDRRRRRSGRRPGRHVGGDAERAARSALPGLARDERRGRDRGCGPGPASGARRCSPGVPGDPGQRARGELEPVPAADVEAPWRARPGVARAARRDPGAAAWRGSLCLQLLAVGYALTLADGAAEAGAMAARGGHRPARRGRARRSRAGPTTGSSVEAAGGRLDGPSCARPRRSRGSRERSRSARRRGCASPRRRRDGPG